MVAKITSPHSIVRTLNYNENKVQKGQAECIYAGNFLQDAKDMNFYQKLNTFKNLMELNTRAQTNTLHISLNFDPSEKLSKEKLAEIASVYMGKIGFGKQPFLVYKHEDAGHPHMHIVSTSIQDNGKRINTYNIGKNQSEKARKEIEMSYGLVKANGRNTRQVQGIEPVRVQRVKYGKSETKRSITNVLDAVIEKYKYTSLPELNSILRQYNIMADRGGEQGRIYRYRGLTYRILDADGNRVGVPIKASSIYSKPTLDYLESKFKQNEQLREPDKQRLKNAIEWTLRNRPLSMAYFLLRLEKEKVTGIVHRNDQGFIYGISFIDHRTKCVFKGSDIGKTYSAAFIQERIAKRMIQTENLVGKLLRKQHYGTDLLKKQIPAKKDTENLKNTLDQKDKSQPENSVSKARDTLEILLRTEKNFNRMPYELMRKKKKKRKLNL
jgi:predicted lactoylglutathione lyase